MEDKEKPIVSAERKQQESRANSPKSQAATHSELEKMNITKIESEKRKLNQYED